MCDRQYLSTILGVVMFVSTASIVPVSAQESGQCGFMCHVPMAARGGVGQMAPRGLRPLEGDFSQMKARFGITVEQEEAWMKFQEAVRSAMPAAHAAPKKELPQTSLERAKFMEELWRRRYEQMQAVTKAFKDLYNVLDDKQKLVADQRFGYCELTR